MSAAQNDGSLLSRSRAAKVETRMGGDLRMAIERHPALAGIALWVGFADTNQDAVAFTDGYTVYAGEAYTKYKPSERLFIIMHELLHVALAHPIRMRQYRARLGNGFRHDLYNIACDAIINASLEGSNNMTAPEDCVKLSKVLEKIGKWDERTMEEAEEVRHWSSESLYQAMLLDPEAFKDMTGEGSGSGDPMKGDMKLPKPGSGNGQQSNGKAKSAAEAQREAEAEIREWSQRLRLTRGTVKGLLDRLAGELPQVKTPWERVLRDFLIRSIGQRNRVDFSRPSRRWLGLEQTMSQREGISLPFEPARTRPNPGGRIAVAVDTSGSIGDEILNRFSGEIAAIMGQTNSKIYLIVCDAEVQQAEEFYGQEGIEKLRHFTYKGGGGTDFKPAIAKAAEWKPDALVYLTDLYGDFGDKPKFPVVWAGIPGTDPNHEVPFGTLMVLD